MDRATSRWAERSEASLGGSGESESKQGTRAAITLGLCMVASMASQLWWAILQRPEILMRRAPADDGFYYLVLAQASPRPTFADGVLTTGFHPLYWVLLLPVTALFDGIAAVRAALALVTLLHQVSGGLLYLGLRQRYAAGPALGAAGLWLLMPGTRVLIVMGVETATLGCALAFVLLVAWKWTEPSFKSSLLMGTAVGLAYLARTDSVAVTLPVALTWAWQGFGLRRETARAVLSVGASALIWAFPWLVYSAARSSLLGSDAMRAERVGSSVRLFLSTERDSVFTVLHLLGDPISRAVGTASSNLLVMVLIVLGAWRVVQVRDRVGAALLAGAALIFVVYGAVGGYTRDWYFVYPLFAVCAGALPPILSGIRRRAVAGVVAVVSIVAALTPSPVLNPQEADKYRAALIAQDTLSPNARVGAFNAGIYQFFTRQDVINLDGVVNPDVQSYRRAHRLCDYLAREGIDYLIDTVEFLERAKGDDPRLVFTNEVDLSASYDPTGRSVTEKQLLVSVDLDRCRASRRG